MLVGVKSGEVGGGKSGGGGGEGGWEKRGEVVNQKSKRNKKKTCIESAEDANLGQMEEDACSC